MPIAEGIAAARLAMDAGSKALDLLRHPKIDGDAIRSRITEMQDLVFSAQRALGEAEEENRRLKHLLDDRTKFEELEKDVEFVEDGQFYVRRLEREAGRIIPYCPVCWKKDDKLIPLTSNRPGDGVYLCQIHQFSYYTQVYHDGVKERNQRITDLNSGKGARRAPRPLSEG